MIRLGICDDDENVLEILNKMVDEHYGDQLQIQKWNSPEQLLFWCEENRSKPLDIIMIDIMLGDKSGIWLAQKLRDISRQIKIIFITGHIEYVTDIFQMEPIYLLKKPVVEEKLVDAVDRAIDKVNQDRKKVVVLHSKGTFFRINIKGISYVETHERKLIIHYEGEDISVYMKMDDMEEKLGELFLRCHHSYLINMDYIKRFTITEIELFDGTVIPVSRPKSKMAKKRFLDYLGGGKIIGLEGEG